MFITKQHLPRRTVLRGFGAALALPLLDGMVPALTALSRTAAAGARRHDLHGTWLWDLGVRHAVPHDSRVRSPRRIRRATA